MQVVFGQPSQHANWAKPLRDHDAVLEYVSEGLRPCGTAFSRRTGRCTVPGHDNIPPVFPYLLSDGQRRVGGELSLLKRLLKHFQDLRLPTALGDHAAIRDLEQDGVTKPLV